MNKILLTGVGSHLRMCVCACVCVGLFPPVRACVCVRTHEVRPLFRLRFATPVGQGRDPLLLLIYLSELAEKGLGILQQEIKFGICDWPVENSANNRGKNHQKISNDFFILHQKGV